MILPSLMRFNFAEICTSNCSAVEWRSIRQDPVLVTQLRKTIISIYSNFAEGFERDGNREFSQFVSVSKGSVKLEGSCFMPWILAIYRSNNSSRSTPKAYG